MKAKLYSKDNCPFCVKAKMLLEMRGAELEEVKLGKDISREELMELLPTARTMPQIFLDDAYIGGYDQLTAYFDKQVASL